MKSKIHFFRYQFYYTLVSANSFEFVATTDVELAVFSDGVDSPIFAVCFDISSSASSFSIVVLLDDVATSRTRRS